MRCYPKWDTFQTHYVTTPFELINKIFEVLSLLNSPPISKTVVAHAFQNEEKNDFLEFRQPDMTHCISRFPLSPIPGQQVPRKRHAFAAPSHTKRYHEQSAVASIPPTCRGQAMSTHTRVLHNFQEISITIEYDPKWRYDFSKVTFRESELRFSVDFDGIHGNNSARWLCLRLSARCSPYRCESAFWG